MDATSPHSAAPPAARKTVGMVSLGCPKALVDSERILTRLRGEGYAVSPTYEGADAVVVNTCAFLDSARAESLEAIAEAQASGKPVIVTGCLGAEEALIRAHAPGVAAVTGAQAYDAVSEAVRRHAPQTISVGALRRGHGAGGAEAHAPPLRLSEDRRGLRPCVQLLHHPQAPRPPRLAAGGRGAARGRSPCGARR